MRRTASLEDVINATNRKPFKSVYMRFYLHFRSFFFNLAVVFMHIRVAIYHYC